MRAGVCPFAGCGLASIEHDRHPELPAETPAASGSNPAIEGRVASASVTRQLDATERLDPPTCGETILCVDDEGPVLRALGRALRRLGYTVLTADNAADALRTCAEGRSPIDLVITDLTMPGITGLTLASELATHHPDVAVILSSGTTVSPGPTRIDALLPKPYTIAELSEVVARVLGRRACTIATR